MPETGYLVDVVVILLAAVVSVSLFQRLKLGAVLGYLVAGAVIGPAGLAAVDDLEATQTLAELGVVFLLFTVGLELPFQRLRVMRGRFFILGLAQVVVTSLAIAAVASLLGSQPATAIVIGGGLAFSSTAIVLRMLSDRGELTTQFGRAVFAVLIIQDLMVGPFLVLVLALGQGQEGSSLAVALGIAALKAAIGVMAMLGVGRAVLRHVFTSVAATREPEIFAALTLFIVLTAALFSHLAGLSLAFGALLAGMLLAESPYRHQVHADIQPFRGLLLGLFFMTVGMQVDLRLNLSEAALISALVVALLLGKAGILIALGRGLGLPTAQALHLGVLLSQGGEFAFVLLGAAMTVGVLPWGDGQLLILVVALSMMLTPLLARLGRSSERAVERSHVAEVEAAGPATEAIDEHVVIVGFGRVGRAVARSLSESGVPFLALDLNPHSITQAQQKGLQAYYGDATRPEVLLAVHVERARAMVVAVDNPKAALQIVAMVRYIFPTLTVYARARDEAHAQELERAGAHSVVPELVATGVKLAGSLLADEKPGEGRG